MTSWIRAGSGAIIALALAGTAQAANLAYTFDAGDQGFTTIMGGDQSTDPAGHLSILDVSSDDMLLVLPPSALGDWSAFVGGTLSFDAINLNGETPDWSLFGEVTISSGASSVMLDIAPSGEPAIGAPWKTFATTLNTATWGPGLSAILNHVTGVTIKVEYHAGVTERVGIDNVRVASAVPEPGGWAMLLAGLPVCLGWMQRRRRQG